MPVPKLLADLLTLPTAPFLEGAVIGFIERACMRLAGVTTRRDAAGNLVAHYRRADRPRPLAFVAHTDHPGFVALEQIDGKTVRAAWRGGVKPEYFPRAGVRFHVNHKWVRGRIREVSRSGDPRASSWGAIPEEVLVRVAAPVAPGSVGMWDLPDPRASGDLLSARACDDVAGAAALLAMLQQLSRGQAATEVYCLFTRAEEYGFIGAIAAARAQSIPAGLPVISIEASSAAAGAQLGGGPILRVGDRMCIFTPELSAFVQRVADESREAEQGPRAASRSATRGRQGARRTAAKQRPFVYQRKLMDGGVCEAYPFLAYGYPATGICVALGNYHNMDTRRRRIASEYISIRDWHQMVQLFVALAVDERGPVEATNEAARARIDARFEERRHLLTSPW